MASSVTNYGIPSPSRWYGDGIYCGNGGQTSVRATFPVMAAYVGLAMCFAVLAAILATASAEHHKKKIIVKVPHIIKHIHHDHYKPIHIHKVRHKKLEHHYRKHEGGKHKSHGSYSHVQPVLAHHDGEDQDFEQRQAMEYNQRQNYGLEYEQGRGYGQYGGWRTEDNRDDWKYRGRPEDSAENDQWRPVGGGYDGEDWGSSEEMSNLREEREHSGGRGNGRKKGIPIIERPVQKDHENDDSGWKPMMDFSNWKDESEYRNGYGSYPSDMYNYSGEQYSGGTEEIYPQEGIGQKKKKKQKRNKKKWNKQIEVREPINEKPPPEQHPQGVKQNQQVQPIQPINLPFPQPTQWPAVAPLKQEQKPWPTFPQPQKLQWPQPTAPTTFQGSSFTQPQPTQMVWSGHHLQLPSQTMWQVQQHSVKAPSSVPSSVSKPVLQPQPVLQHQPQPVLQHQPQPVQLSQPSLVVHQSTSPQWPLTQRAQQPQGQPMVKQQWQQSVSTSGSHGPAASYKVEVINYANPKSSTS